MERGSVTENHHHESSAHPHPRQQNATRPSPPASSLCPYGPLEALKRTITKDESLCHSASIIASIMASRRHKTVGYDNTWAARWFIPFLQTQTEL